MVPCTGSHAHLQRVHARHRYLERRLRACRDAQRQAPLPRPRLCVHNSRLCVPRVTDEADPSQIITSSRLSSISSAHPPWMTFTRSPPSGQESTSARCPSGRRSRSASSSRGPAQRYVLHFAFSFPGQHGVLLRSWRAHERVDRLGPHAQRTLTLTLTLHFRRRSI